MGVVLAAGAVGVGLGVGLSALMSDDDPAPPGAAAPSTAAPLTKLRVRILGAVLHPARTASGQQRRRARLAVRVRAENTAATRVTLARPAILAAGETVHSDPQADSPRTHLGTLGPGMTQAVTLRFEVAGKVTAQLVNERTGRLRIAGRTIGLNVKVGAPLSAGS